jgi:folate-dependent tRNA-U54 methylase TrmFO/GidA
MIGSLMDYIHTPNERFQPMNANMGLLPAVPRERGGRKARYLRVSQRAADAMEAYRNEHSWLFEPGLPNEPLS